MHVDDRRHPMHVDAAARAQMDLKSKLLLAISSLAPSSSATITSAISSAIRRGTDPRDTPPDDALVHELLFLLSNHPSSSSFLSRRLSLLLESSHRRPLPALKSLLLLHRLLRAAHPRLELDIRDLHSTGVLRLHSPHHPSPFLRYYSRFISERTSWAIDHSGLLQPVGPSPIPREPLRFAAWRLSRCQDFLDRVLDGFVRPDNRVGWEALCVVLKESFRVYSSFADGLDLLLSSPTAAFDVSILPILRRSSSQTNTLREFYEACRGVVGCKGMDFPNVDTTTIEKLLSTGPPPAAGNDEAEDWKLETRINTEWVKF